MQSVARRATTNDDARQLGGTILSTRSERVERVKHIGYQLLFVTLHIQMLRLWTPDLPPTLQAYRKPVTTSPSRIPPVPATTVLSQTSFAWFAITSWNAWTSARMAVRSGRLFREGGGMRGGLVYSV
jgi:hypothetical protein